MEPITQDMRLTKSTKGTHFYEALIVSSSRIRNVYISKDAFQGQQPPQNITITVTEQK